jgi:DNA-binding transcriptional MerR regulator
MEERYTLKQVGNRVGVHFNTIAEWSRAFADLTDPAGVPPPGSTAQRRYTDRDVALFRHAKALSKKGHSRAEILARLTAMPVEERYTMTGEIVPAGESATLAPAMLASLRKGLAAEVAAEVLAQLPASPSATDVAAQVREQLRDDLAVNAAQQRRWLLYGLAAGLGVALVVLIVAAVIWGPW